MKSNYYTIGTNPTIPRRTAPLEATAHIDLLNATLINVFIVVVMFVIHNLHHARLWRYQGPWASSTSRTPAMRRGAVNYLHKPVVRPEPPTVEEMEWEHIQRVLDEYDGNVSATAPGPEYASPHLATET